MPGYGVVRGPDVIGRAWTPWLSFTGDEIDAAQALAIGLVQRVVPHDRLLDEAVELAGRIAANPPFAVRVARSFVDAGRADRALADSVEATALLFSTDDHRQAVARFLERPRRDRA
jgi:enoyl-CoA hydratase